MVRYREGSRCLDVNKRFSVNNNMNKDSFILGVVTLQCTRILWHVHFGCVRGKNVWLMLLRASNEAAAGVAPARVLGTSEERVRAYYIIEMIERNVDTWCNIDTYIVMSSSEIASIEAKFAALEARNISLEARVSFLESQAAVTASKPAPASASLADSGTALVCSNFSHADPKFLDIPSSQTSHSPLSIWDPTGLEGTWYMVFTYL
jgi:hypothetical protein